MFSIRAGQAAERHNGLPSASTKASIAHIALPNGYGTAFFADVPELGADNLVVTALHNLPKALLDRLWEQNFSMGFLAADSATELALDGAVLATANNGPQKGELVSGHAYEAPPGFNASGTVKVKLVPSYELAALGADVAVLSAYDHEGKPLSTQPRLELSKTFPQQGQAVKAFGFPGAWGWYGAETPASLNAKMADIHEDQKRIRFEVKYLDDVIAGRRDLHDSVVRKLTGQREVLKQRLEAVDETVADSHNWIDRLVKIQESILPLVEQELSSQARKDYEGLYAEENALWSSYAQIMARQRRVVAAQESHLINLATRILLGQYGFSGTTTEKILRDTARQSDVILTEPSLAALIDAMGEDPVTKVILDTLARREDLVLPQDEGVDAGRLARLALERSKQMSNLLLEVVALALAWSTPPDSYAVGNAAEPWKNLAAVSTKRMQVVSKLKGVAEQQFGGSYEELSGRVEAMIAAGNLAFDTTVGVAFEKQFGVPRAMLVPELTGRAGPFLPIHFETTIPSGPGLSGGPVLNDQGSVLGMIIGGDVSNNRTIGRSTGVSSALIRRALELKGTIPRSSAANHRH